MVEGYAIPVGGEPLVGGDDGFGVDVGSVLGIHPMSRPADVDSLQEAVEQRSGGTPLSGVSSGPYSVRSTSGTDLGIRPWWLIS